MFKILDEVCTPTRATQYSAMVDLYARESVVIGAGETKIVPLGVKIDLDLLLKKYMSHPNRCSLDGNYKIAKELDFQNSHFLELHPRSSLRAKGLIIGVGVIDLDYPDEIGLIVHNPITWNDVDFICKKQTPYEAHFKKGDKVAQCTLKEHKGYLLGIESDAERSGGFGSTGM